MILSDFKGLKHIPRIKGTCGKNGIDELKDKDGNVVSDAKGVVNIFANFYESLYSRPSATGAPKPDIPAFIPEECTEDAFDIDELIKALKSMKNRKAKDEAGVIAEMIKEGSRDFLQLVLEMFNDIFMHRTELPSSWKKCLIKVLFKKGVRDLPKNYRPISIVPILSKLFSKIVCNRLTPILGQSQDVEQAAYRKTFSTVDHLLAATILIEKCGEHGCPLWLALVDFEKAFDLVDHEALWRTLLKQNVPIQYIALLQKLYEGQSACIQTGVRSRSFSIERGVKQGDPLSALLFIAVMQDICGNLQLKWDKANKRRKNTHFRYSHWTRR